MRFFLSQNCLSHLLEEERMRDAGKEGEFKKERKRLQVYCLTEQGNLSESVIKTGLRFVYTAYIRCIAYTCCCTRLLVKMSMHPVPYPLPFRGAIRTSYAICTSISIAIAITCAIAAYCCLPYFCLFVCLLWQIFEFKFKRAWHIIQCLQAVLAYSSSSTSLAAHFAVQIFYEFQWASGGILRLCE